MNPRRARTAARPEVPPGAYDRLHAAIQSGELRPGARLVEQELATWAGASRTPIREALARLEAEGLVVREPGRGTRVVELDAGMVAELYVMREVLEGTAAALAARHASDAELAALREIAKVDRRPGKRSPAARSENNRRFHDTLYRCAHNHYLLRAVSALREAMAVLGNTTLGLTGRSETALEEHEKLLRALEARDAAAAESAAREHIRAAYRARLELMLQSA